jgi:type VI secretion system protein ImpG
MLGEVLAHFLANHVTINSYVETEIVSATRGSLITWPPSRGRNPIV